MDFVINNYLWFIIGAIVLLMIIIGYFAEKTNFGKIPLNANKEKKEKEDKTVEEEVDPIKTEVESMPMDQIGIADAVAPEEPLNIPLESTETTETIPTEVMPEEDLNVPFGDMPVDEPMEVESKSESEVTDELPDVPEVIGVNEENNASVTDESEDDVWKF